MRACRRHGAEPCSSCIARQVHTAREDSRSGYLRLCRLDKCLRRVWCANLSRPCCSSLNMPRAAAALFLTWSYLPEPVRCLIDDADPALPCAVVQSAGCWQPFDVFAARIQVLETLGITYYPDKCVRLLRLQPRESTRTTCRRYWAIAVPAWGIVAIVSGGVSIAPVGPTTRGSRDRITRRPQPWPSGWSSLCYYDVCRDEPDGHAASRLAGPDDRSSSAPHARS